MLLESEVIAREVQSIQNTTDIKRLWLKRESITSGKEFDEVSILLYYILLDLTIVLLIGNIEVFTRETQCVSCQSTLEANDWYM